MGEAGRMVIYAEVHCGGSLLRFVREISGIGLLAVLNTVLNTCSTNISRLPGGINGTRNTSAKMIDKLFTESTQYCDVISGGRRYSPVHRKREILKHRSTTLSDSNLV